MSNLKLAANSDGRLELFYTDENHRIFHRWQKNNQNNGKPNNGKPNNGNQIKDWSDESRLGTTELASSFEVERNLNGRLEIFYVGTDGNFYHKRQKEDWEDQWGEESLLSQIQLEEFAIPFRLRKYKIGKNKTGRLRGEDGRLEIFYISSTDNHLYHKRQTAPNSTVWTDETKFPILGNPLCDRITIGQNKDGRLDVFCTYPNGVLFHRTQKAADSDQWNFEKVFYFEDSAIEMVAGQNSDGRQELFYIGTNSGIYHRWQTKASDDDSWSNEARLGDDGTASQIAVGRNADRRLELFYIGTNNKLYHKWQIAPNGGWSAETRLSDTDKAFDIAIGSNEDGRLEVFYRDEDGKIHHTWQAVKNGNWSPSQIL